MRLFRLLSYNDHLTSPTQHDLSVVLENILIVAKLSVGKPLRIFILNVEERKNKLLEIVSEEVVDANDINLQLEKLRDTNVSIVHVPLTAVEESR